MPETDKQSRLRRYLAAYERLCRRYSLYIYFGIPFTDVPIEQAYERYKHTWDGLPSHLKRLKKGGITE